MTITLPSSDGALQSDSRSYVGRFAPSPSGQLHFGSLVTALASYLDARSKKGTWLVRMEDIDEPRCINGMDIAILNTLEAHGLTWDGEIIYQSQQHHRYQDSVDSLLTHNKAYYCQCTRKQINAMGGRYNGQCRDKKFSADGADKAIRLPLTGNTPSFNDGILGLVPEGESLEDIVIKRRDGLYSYNLVVVLDDDYQGVNHIVRGADLLPVTATQIALYRSLGLSVPQYSHIPVASVAPGRKLSKQNHAKPLDNSHAIENLHRAMTFLSLSPYQCQEYQGINDLLKHAVSLWNVKKVPKTPEIIVDAQESTYHSQR